MPNNSYDNHWRNAVNHAPNADFETVEHGWEQHVLIDHIKEIVYRYPRNQAASAKLNDEVNVLDQLQHYKWPVKIPKLVEHHTDYSAYRYIPGAVLDDEMIGNLSDKEAGDIGTKLGEFFLVMHSVSHTVVTAKKTKQTTSLLDYYSERIYGASDTTYKKHALKDLSLLSEKPMSNHVVVHGDLHGLNMVIDPMSHELVGVIDFSELEIGDPDQDFRKIFMADKRLLQPAIDSYNKGSSRTIELNRVKHWAYVNEWANLCYFASQPNNPTFIRATNHLHKWGRL